MATHVEAGAQVPGFAQHHASNSDLTDLVLLAASLAAALEDALLAAHRLRDALSPAACHTEAATRTQAAMLGRAYAALEGLAGEHGARRVAPLSRREAEVLRLLATGMSNHQIAQALFLSPRTVQRHVANLYPKIGTHRRAEATAYALRHGLA